MQDKFNVKRLAIMAALCGLSIILGYVEAIIPINFGIPGVKLGLANLVTVIMIFLDSYNLKFGEILSICLVRILIVGFLFGNMYGIIYSLCGGLVSLISMFLISRFNKFGVLGVSSLGGLTHNVAQLFVAMLVVDELKLVYYLPILLLSGSVFGALLGVLSTLILKRLERIKGGYL